MKIVMIGKKHGCVRMRKAAWYARSQGHECHLIMGINKGAGALNAYPQNMWVDGFPTYTSNAQNSKELVAAIDMMKPDVVYAHELEPMWALTHQATDEQAAAHILDGVPMEDTGMSVTPTPWPLVYDAHENEMGTWQPSYRSPKFMEDRAWIEDKIVGEADRVTAATPGIAGRIHYEFNRTAVLVNNAPAAPQRMPERALCRRILDIPEEMRVVIFNGYATSERKLNELVFAMSLLGSKWKIVLMGNSGFCPLTDAALRGAGALFLNAMPYPYDPANQSIGMLDYTSMGDVGYCGAELGIDNWKVGLPNKAFEYGFAGVPMVCSEMPDTVALVKKYKLGSSFDGTPRDLAAKIEETYANGFSVAARACFINEQGYDKLGGPAMLLALENAVGARK